jgi:hypothetical protein
LTCTKFKAISRPHLFNEFYFRPYKSGGTDGILLPPTTEVNRAMERLEFWCSDEIAPHVRSCVIAPWHESGPCGQDGTLPPRPLLTYSWSRSSSAWGRLLVWSSEFFCHRHSFHTIRSGQFMPRPSPG